MDIQPKKYKPPVVPPVPTVPRPAQVPGTGAPLPPARPTVPTTVGSPIPGGPAPVAGGAARTATNTYAGYMRDTRTGPGGPLGATPGAPPASQVRQGFPSQSAQPGGKPINIRSNVARKPIRSFPSRGRPVPAVNPLPVDMGLGQLPVDPNMGVRGAAAHIPLEEGLPTKFPALQSRSPSINTPPINVPPVGEGAGAQLTSALRRPATTPPNAFHPEGPFEIPPPGPFQPGSVSPKVATTTTPSSAFTPQVNQIPAQSPATPGPFQPGRVAPQVTSIPASSPPSDVGAAFANRNAGSGIATAPPKPPAPTVFAGRSPGIPTPPDTSIGNRTYRVSTGARPSDPNWNFYKPPGGASGPITGEEAYSAFGFNPNQGFHDALHPEAGDPNWKFYDPAAAASGADAAATTAAAPKGGVFRKGANLVGRGVGATGRAIKSAPGALLRNAKASAPLLAVEALAHPEGAAWAAGHPGEAISSFAGGIGDLRKSLGDGRARAFGADLLRGRRQAWHSLNEGINPAMTAIAAGDNIAHEVSDAWNGKSTLRERLGSAFDAPSQGQQARLDFDAANNPNHLTPENLQMVQSMGQNPLHYSEDRLGNMVSAPGAPPMSLRAPMPGAAPMVPQVGPAPGQSAAEFNAQQGQAFDEENPFLTAAKGVPGQMADMLGRGPKEQPGGVVPAQAGGAGPVPARGVPPQAQGAPTPAVPRDRVRESMMRAHDYLTRSGAVGQGESMADLNRQYHANVLASGKAISDYDSARAQDTEAKGRGALAQEQARPEAERLGEIKGPIAQANFLAAHRTDPQAMPGILNRTAAEVASQQAGGNPTIDASNWRQQLAGNPYFANFQKYLLPDGKTGRPMPVDQILDYAQNFPGGEDNPNVRAMVAHGVRDLYPGTDLEDARYSMTPGLISRLLSSDNSANQKRLQYGARLGLWGSQ